MTVRRTIVELDLLGYSDISAQLEQAHDASAVAQLCAQIQDFVDVGLSAARVQRADSVFKTTGDGALLSLANPEIAHRFAATVQDATRQHNLRKTLPIGLRVFRIGVATGDVDVREIDGHTDHFGDTVSRACRLEAKAQPGGVLIDAETFASLPPDLQSLYRGPETVQGKREERYQAWAWQANPDGPADAVRLGAGQPAAKAVPAAVSTPVETSAPSRGALDGGVQAQVHPSLCEPAVREAASDVHLDFIQVPERIRDMLCDEKRMPAAFSGPWVEALIDQLRRSFGDGLRNSVAAVVECFQVAPTDRIKSLFQAIRKANEKVRPDHDPARAWAVQFTLLAASRCIKPECWTEFERLESGQTRRGILAGRAATPNALIASVGVAGLLGQVIHVDSDRRLQNIVDLDCLDKDVEIQRWIEGQIYDQLVRAPKHRRSDPCAKLTPIEFGRLRNLFDDWREDHTFGAIVLRLPEFDQADALEICRGIAKAINATVIAGLSEHADIVHADTGLEVGDLEARLEQLIGRVEAGTATNPAPSVAPSPQYHVFISYASDDREPFVTALHDELAALGLEVWRDQGRLTMGDGLMDSINRGLAGSRYAVVILSEAFLAKPWTREELAAVFSRQMLEQRKCILPVLLGIEHERVVQTIPLLADKLCSRASDGAKSVAQDILKAVIAGR